MCEKSNITSANLFVHIFLKYTIRDECGIREYDAELLTTNDERVREFKY